VGGFCGVLHGMSGMMTHLSFIETLLVFIPALFAALTLIGLSFVNRYEYAPSHSRIAMPLLEHGPEISRKEISWLAHHTNSPGAF